MGNVLGKDILAIQQDFALEAGAAHRFVHAVERAKERGFAAAGRADQRGDAVGGHMQIDAVQSMHLAVIEIKIADLHPQGSLYGSLRAARHRRFYNSVHVSRHRTPWGVRLTESRFYRKLRHSYDLCARSSARQNGPNHDIGDQHQTEQNQPCRPGLLVPIIIRPDGISVRSSPASEAIG